MARRTRRAPKVSVIMPARNVDRFVGRAIESFQNQTLKDFELLVVDDGSSDRTGQIAARASERDIRIDVIATPGVGVAGARNEALARANGEYVLFARGDDWAEPGLLAELVSCADDNSLDLVVGGFSLDTRQGDKGSQSEVRAGQKAVYLDQPAFRASAVRLLEGRLLDMVWGMLFRRTALVRGNRRFDEASRDDLPFVLAVISDIERVGVIDSAGYHHVRPVIPRAAQRWRPGLYEECEEEHGWVLSLLGHWGVADDPASIEAVQRVYADRLVSCMENMFRPGCTLSARERREEAERIVSSEGARRAAEVAKPKSWLARVLLASVRRQDTGMVLAEARIAATANRLAGGFVLA